MSSIPFSARKILEQRPVETSAPCRIDSGGTWDIKALALPLQRIRPCTFNMALNLRTRVILSPYKDNRVRISSQGLIKEEEHPFEYLPFDSVFGIFYGAISYFGMHGLNVEIRSDSPVKAALGGSSTALVALIKALSILSELSGSKGLSPGGILHLAYHIEDGISGGNCGIQDQAAAVYGGVNLWTWSYGKRDAMLKREALVDRKGLKDLSDRILVAYSGRSHVSMNSNRAWISSFLTGVTRTGWIKVNDIVRSLALSIKERDWRAAVRFLREEVAIRREITPNALIPITERLISLAEEAGCGARFTGAGAGGSVWALGEPGDIEKLKDAWKETLAGKQGGRILGCVLDPDGVK